jgi:hypothetical protein
MFKHPLCFYQNYVELGPAPAGIVFDLPLDDRRRYIDDIRIEMNAAAGTPHNKETHEEAANFEQEVDTAATNKRDYNKAMRDEIRKQSKISDARVLTEATAEMLESEEDCDVLSELMEELDSMLNYDLTLQQGVADYVKDKMELHGRTTFRSLAKGPHPRA